MIKAIIFDMDGTLLDRDSSLEGFLSDQYKRFSLAQFSVPEDGFKSSFIKRDANGRVPKPLVYTELQKEFCWPSTVTEDLVQDYVCNAYGDAALFAHVEPVLKVLTERNLRLGIITNGLTHFQLRNFWVSRLAVYIQTIVVSETEGVRKPDPRIFIKGLELLGVDAHECIFVGDDPISDIEGSLRVGMKAIRKESKWFTDHVPRGHTFSCYGDFLSVLDECSKQ